MVHRIALFIASLTAALVLTAGLALNGLAPAADPASGRCRRGARRHGPRAHADREGRHRLRHAEGQAQARHRDANRWDRPGGPASMSTSARAGAGTTDDRAPIDSRRARGPEAAARLASADAGSRPPLLRIGVGSRSQDRSRAAPAGRGIPPHAGPVHRHRVRLRAGGGHAPVRRPGHRCRRRISAYDRSGGHRGCACPLGPACQAVRRPEAGPDAAAQRPRPRPADPDASRHRRHPDTPVGEAVMVAMELSRSASAERAMMGGRVSVHLRDVPVSAAAGDPATRVLDRIAVWAQRLTRFDPTSELMRLNAAGVAAVRVGPTLTAVLDWARELEGRTDGRIDVAMLDARLSAEAGEPIDPPSAAARRWSLRRLPRGAIVERPPHLRFDLDGVAKGWLADRALALAPGPSAMIDADGDIAARVAGGDSWMVGVADPRDQPDGLLAVVRLASPGTCGTIGLATSGTSVHRWDRTTRRRPPPDRSGDVAIRHDGRRPGDGPRGQCAPRGGVRQGRRARRRHRCLRAREPPRHPRTAAAHGGGRGPRERGDGPMAGVTYRGFDSRTVARALGPRGRRHRDRRRGHAPGRARRDRRGRGHQPGEPAVAVRAPVRVPRLSGDHRVRGVRAAALDQGAGPPRPPAGVVPPPQGPRRHRRRAGRDPRDAPRARPHRAVLDGADPRAGPRTPRDRWSGIRPGRPLPRPHRDRQLLHPTPDRPPGLAGDPLPHVRCLHRRDRSRDRCWHRRRLAVGAGDLRDRGNGGRVPPGLSHRPVDRTRLADRRSGIDVAR